MNKLVMSDMLLYNMNNMVTGNIQHNKLYSTSYMSNKYIEYKIQNSESSVNNEYMSDMNILVWWNSIKCTDMINTKLNIYKLNKSNIKLGC